MRTLTPGEVIAWCREHAILIDEPARLPAAPHDLVSARHRLPPETRRLIWFCRYVEAKLQPWDRCLLWVTSWGIWESSENWHLYYRLRQSYGDLRLIEEAPGHLFLGHESHDLTSFLAIGLSAGWDMCVLPSNGRGRAVFSHDGWFELALSDETEVQRMATELAGNNILG